MNDHRTFCALHICGDLPIHNTDTTGIAPFDWASSNCWSHRKLAKMPAQYLEVFQVKITCLKIPGPKNKRRRKKASWKSFHLNPPCSQKHSQGKLGSGSQWGGTESPGSICNIQESNFNNLASWNTTKLCKLFSRATYWPWKPRLSMSSKSMSWSKLESWTKVNTSMVALR